MNKLVTREYLAGVLDSDGSLTITKRHIKRSNANYAAMIQITWLHNTNSEYVFKFLKRYYGDSYFIGKTHSKFSTNTKIIKYCATGNTVERILLDCRNSIILKQKQCKNLLNLIDYKNSLNKKRLKKECTKMEKLYINNRRLNGSKV